MAFIRKSSDFCVVFLIISPVLVSMKLLFQELCSENYDWDDELNEEKRRKWDVWLNELTEVKFIEIDRCLHKTPRDDVLEYQLHGFADASNKLKRTQL